MISEFQMSLLGAGVAAVVAIFAYNKWQESRHRRMAEQIFRTDNADVLLEGNAAALASQEEGRLEPSLAEEPIPTLGDDARVIPEADAQWRPSPPSQEELLAPINEVPLQAVRDDTDWVAQFTAREPIPGPLLWPAQQDALPRLAKPLLWFGLNEKRGAWDSLSAHSAGRYRRLAAALQLVDRAGPVSDADLQRFFNGVRQVATHFGAELHLEDVSVMPERAAQLDQFCVGVDVQIGINVVSKSENGVPGTKLRGMAEAAGFSLQDDGAFHFVDDEGKAMFALAAQDGTPLTPEYLRGATLTGVTLSLDVPRVKDGANVFGRMNVVAQQLALALNGVVVDDNRAPLDERSVSLIRGKVGEFQRALSQRGIEPGGALAQRLFS